jgi:hypothetical protein
MMPAPSAKSRRPRPTNITVSFMAIYRMSRSVFWLGVMYLDDNKMASFTLSRERHDPINGILSVDSPLGSRLLGRVAEDETEFEVDGRSRPVLIVRTERQAATMH